MAIHEQWPCPRMNQYSQNDMVLGHYISCDMHGQIAPINLTIEVSPKSQGFSPFIHVISSIMYIVLPTPRATHTPKRAHAIQLITFCQLS